MVSIHAQVRHANYADANGTTMGQHTTDMHNYNVANILKDV